MEHSDAERSWWGAPAIMRRSINVVTRGPPTERLKGDFAIHGLRLILKAIRPQEPSVSPVLIQNAASEVVNRTTFSLRFRKRFRLPLFAGTFSAGMSSPLMVR